MDQDQVEVYRMGGVDVEENSMAVGIVTEEVDRMVIVAAEHYMAGGTAGMAERCLEGDIVLEEAVHMPMSRVEVAVMAEEDNHMLMDHLLDSHPCLAIVGASYQVVEHLLVVVNMDHAQVVTTCQSDVQTQL